MDVQDLAPALLALADLVQLANRKFNGSLADIKVLVNADVEQRCFMIDVSLVQSILDQAKSLLTTENVKTAEDIARWVGILGGGQLARMLALAGYPLGLICWASSPFSEPLTSARSISSSAPSVRCSE